MRLELDSLDRLVAYLGGRGGSAPVEEAARHLLALSAAPAGLERRLLAPLLRGDPRLAFEGRTVVLRERAPVVLARARFVVFDLETTGLDAGRDRIWEIGAVRVAGGRLGARFETLAAPEAGLTTAPGRPHAPPQGLLARAPSAASALRRFSRFAGEAVLVAHNARFDAGFVNGELARRAGGRLASPVLDTLPLARALLRGRVERLTLAALATFFGTATAPCHRALPDALATAEVLLRLLELAGEAGAATLAQVEELAAPLGARRAA